MHQHDCQGIETRSSQLLELSARRLFIELFQDFPVRAYALVNLDHPFGQLFGQDDMPCEYFRPRLVADPQGVCKAARDGERQPFPLTLEQGVGRDGGADAQFGNRARAIFGKEPTNSLAGGIVIATRIFGQQLGRNQPAIGRRGDDIGECAAAIHRKSPGRLFAHMLMRAESA